MSDQEEEDSPILEDEAVSVEDLEEEALPYDINKIFQLGDRIVIKSERYGPVWGTVYYRDNDLLRLRPDSAASILYDFPRVYDEERDEFAPDLGVTESFILRKRNPAYPDFVRQQNFRVGQYVDAIGKDGTVAAHYKITAVNEEEDTIDIVNVDDEADATHLEFNFVGIPTDLEFQSLRIVNPPKKVEDVKEETEEAEAEAEEADEEAEDEEDDDLEILDTDEFEVELEGLVILPQQTVYKEATASRKLIPETIQKSEALKDFLNLLEPSQQKDPKIIRQFRILVETLNHMKYAISKVKADGSLALQSPSPTTLVDLVDKGVPMGRAVLDVQKRLYREGRATENADTDQLHFVNETIATESTVTPFSSTLIETSAGISQINFYTTLQTEYEHSERPWKAGEKGSTVTDFNQDTPFFRSMLPSKTDQDVEGYINPNKGRTEGKEEGEGGRRRKKEEDEPIPFPELGTLSYSMETALTTTYRKGRKGAKHVMLNAEAAPIRHYLLFPTSVAPSLGSKRSGSLALDMSRSKSGSMGMDEILQKEPLGNKTNQIVVLNVTGSTLSNISLKDYLEGMIIPGTGLGDMMSTLIDYGLLDQELNSESLAVLQAKMANYQGQLITSLNQVREAIKAISPPVPNPMLPIESTPILDTLFRSEKILVDVVKAFAQQNPVLKDSDVARVAYFLHTYGDYYQAAIGKQVPFVIEERDKAIKTIQLTMIQNDEQVKRNKRARGEVPKPNLCEHVAKLKAIRREREELDRYMLLTKFLSQYQGKRSENWIDCKICKKELLCVHERLLIKAFLVPKEREAIFKELHLHFAGGVFSGHYICRNCGQPIQEIGYDTNIQFDESGKPMVGRAVLNDKDALKASDLEAVLGIPLEVVDEFEFDDANYVKFYRILRELAERVGIFMERGRYESVIKKMIQLDANYPSREEFAAMQEDKRKKKAKAGQEFVASDYDMLIAKNTIGSAALHLLLEVQTRSPAYTPQFSLPNCNPGFGGFPLDEEKDNQEGLIYMACAIASVHREDEPWATAQFFTIPKGKGREDQIASILKYILPILGDIMEEQGSALQEQLSEKRSEMEKQEAERALVRRPVDQVPSYFLPELVLPPVTEAAAEEVVDPRANARAWIRNAHQLAKDNVKLVRGSLIADVTCCRASIAEPGIFWREDLARLPLGKRQLVPAKRGTLQQFMFEARTHESAVVEIPKDLTYRLFLHTCYKGDNEGKPHQIGATNRCRICHFQLPEHPSLITADKAKDAVASAEIDDSLDAFQHLLDIVHRTNSIVETATKAKGTPVFEEIRDLTPPPLPDWAPLFRETMAALNKLDGSNSGEVAEANAALSNAVSEAETFVKDTIVAKGKYKNPDKKHGILDKLAGLGWHNFVQVIETYFITPAKNLLNQYDSDRLNSFFDYKTMPAYVKRYAKSHLEDLKGVLDEDHAVLNLFVEDLNADDKGFARAKLAHFVRQMSAIARLKNRLRPLYFVGGVDTFQHLQGAFLYGPLAELLNSSKIPYVEDIEAPLETRKKQPLFDTSITMLIKIIGASLDQFDKHRLGYSDEELREIIQRRAEQEKQNILSKLDKMSDEERRVATMNMRLGLGRYNVDKLKRIIKYSAEQIELERKEGEEAGIAMSLSRSALRDDDMEVEGIVQEEPIADAPLDEAAAEQAEGYDDHTGGGEAAEFGEED